MLQLIDSVSILLLALDKTVLWMMSFAWNYYPPPPPLPNFELAFPLLCIPPSCMSYLLHYAQLLWSLESLNKTKQKTPHHKQKNTSRAIAILLVLPLLFKDICIWLKTRYTWWHYCESCIFITHCIQQEKYLTFFKHPAPSQINFSWENTSH